MFVVSAGLDSVLLTENSGNEVVVEKLDEPVV
jgi:hypothetical protein